MCLYKTLASFLERDVDCVVVASSCDLLLADAYEGEYAVAGLPSFCGWRASRSCIMVMFCMGIYT